MNYKIRDIFPKDETCLTAILQQRGVTDIDNFLHPSKKCENDYHLLDNIDKGINMLLKHLQQNNSILFIVDADADGITSAAILWLYIKALFSNADLHFQVHDGKKHGLEDQIDYLINDEQFDLVICPDSASNDIECFNRLKEINTDILVLDHHICSYLGYDSIPDNVALINNQQSLNYPNKFLCGAGVVYKFCQALDHYFKITKAQDYLDLVALGEISDVMNKANNETNYYMACGLNSIKNQGLITLLKAQEFSLKERAREPFSGLTTIDIAFYITPLINAIVRVGTLKDNENLFRCFIEPLTMVHSTKRGAKENDMETIADQIARVGKNCKAKQDRIKQKAFDLLKFRIEDEGADVNKIIIAQIKDSDEIPQSMTGLIAQELSSYYNKPCLVGRVHNNLLQGSGRGNQNFISLPSLQSYLKESDFFEMAEGHDNAFGYSIKANTLNDFIEFINNDLPENAFDKCSLVDYEFYYNEQSLYKIAWLLASSEQYFGNGIDESEIVIKNIPLEHILIMGEDKSSIRITANNINYIKFKDIDFINQITENRHLKINVLGKPKLNTYNGKTSLQLLIKDYEFVNNYNKFDF